MVQRILVAVDGSSQSDEALEHALSAFPDADVTVLTVVDPVDVGYAGSAGPDVTGGETAWNAQAREHAERVLERAAETAAASGRDVDTVQIIDRPARGIVDYAEEHDVDTIVVGSHGRTGVSRILLGSVAEKVVRRAPCKVTVVR